MNTLRRWQVKAREVVHTLRIGGVDRALIAACTGSGKTRYAASLLADDFATGAIECAVIVTPTRVIKKQWKYALHAYGLKAIADIDNSTLDERRARGMALYDPARPIFIVTYQQVCTGVEWLSVLCARHKVVGVFDEIHHADDQQAFGERLMTAFEDARFKLSLSGTPFTTRGSRLAFCECDRQLSEDGQPLNVTRPDYAYSYGEALQATGTDDDPYVVRPVTFIRWNGQARWRYQSVANPEEFTERLFDGTRKTDPLLPLLDADGEYLKKMIRAALDELEEIRRHHDNAGMLITTMDGGHCDQVADIVRACGVRDVVVVRYDLPGSHQKIEAFAKSRDRVLIAVNMVAEGVDITRLRVGVYASDTKTWMYFMQFVGRFLRWDSSLNAGQFATVFVPEHVLLITYAKKIEQMVLEAAIPMGEGGDGGPQQPKCIVVEKTSEGSSHGAVQHGLFYEADETEQVQAWMRASNVFGKLSLAEGVSLWRTRHQTPAGSAQASAPVDEPDESKRNDQLVGRVVMYAQRKGRTDLTYETVNTWANRQVGIPRKDKLTPIAVLVQRREHLQRLVLSVLQESDDGAASA